MASGISVDLERERYEPGDEVRGTITNVSAGERTQLTVALFYFERTRVGDEEGVVVAIDDSLHSGAFETGQCFTFQLPLPPTALPAYKSRHIEMGWQVVVTFDSSRTDEYWAVDIEVGDRAGTGEELESV